MPTIWGVAFSVSSPPIAGPILAHVCYAIFSGVLGSAIGREPCARGRPTMNDAAKPAQPEPTRPPQATAGAAPRFVTGPIFWHIMSTTGLGALGLMALFMGDLANRLFLGQLGDEHILAAIGYASSILFFATSVGIGLSIAATSVVSPAVGARDVETARRLSGSAHAFALLIAVGVTAAVWPMVPWLIRTLGAKGHTADLAMLYLRILLPSLPFLVVAMCSGAVLRSVGDARRATNITLIGAVVNILLDPLFIFVLKLDLAGAAYASFIARMAMCAIGLWGVIKVHGMITWPAPASVQRDAVRIGTVALPAVLANVATPVGNAYVTATISSFGDPGIAAWAAYNALNPVAFGAIFALSGAIGPIIGQNLGAGRFDRVSETVTDALKATVLFTAVAWIVLALAAPMMARAFGLSAESAGLLVFACRWLSPFFAFLGALFVSNAVFNTLGHAHYATLLNWGRATLGTVPLVMVGGQWAGAAGVFTGSMVGGALFGMAGVYLARREVAKLQPKAQ
jgi:putative MATE family efflux protein